MSTTVRTQAGAMSPQRRAFLGNTAKIALSASAVALMAGCQTMAKSSSAATAGAASGDSAQDASILNVALGLEHEAIGAYQLGAESGLLSKQVVATAVQFQSQHKEHRDALSATIVKLGGTPVDAKSLADYAKDLNATSLRNQGDVLMLAAKLEKGAANAYIGVIPAFSDPTFGQIAARLAADETMHWTVLASALGQPLPKMALTFGA